MGGSLMADAGRVLIIPRGTYNASTTYEKLDAVLYKGKGYIALKTVTGIAPSDDGVNWQIYVDNADIDANVLKPDFTMANERKNISTGETLSTIFGKIMKFFADIKGHAYKDLATTLDVVQAGTALDAATASTAINKLNKDTAPLVAQLNHNIPRITPKDLTSYIADGSFYKRLNGTDGYSLFEDIFVGDYIKMSRPITCPNQDSSVAVTGSQYVTVIGLDTLMYNGDSPYINYHHAVMTAGQGFGGAQYFGRHRMNATNTSEGGYVGSEMNKSIIGDVVTSGSTSSGATINQQLYAEFGSHLKTTRELVSNSINATGSNRFGSNTGCSNNWAWTSMQAIPMSEVEVYGSTVWSSSGYDTGSAKMQMPLFAHSRTATNNRNGWYWLKDVASGTIFCGCGNDGIAGYSGASNIWCYVRPRFVIGA